MKLKSSCSILLFAFVNCAFVQGAPLDGNAVELLNSINEQVPENSGYRFS